jgi:hypothetical protein
MTQNRVARRPIFKPKIQIWVNLGGKVLVLAIWSILQLFYGYLVFFSSFGMLYHEKSGNSDKTRASPLVVFFVIRGVISHHLEQFNGVRLTSAGKILPIEGLVL